MYVSSTGSNMGRQSNMQHQQNYYQHQQMPRGGHWGAPRSDAGNGMPNRTVSAQTWAQYKEQQQHQGRRYWVTDFYCLFLFTLVIYVHIVLFSSVMLSSFNFLPDDEKIIWIDRQSFLRFIRYATDHFQAPLGLKTLLLFCVSSTDIVSIEKE